MSSAGKRPEGFPPRQAMLTGDTLSTEEVSVGDSNNNEPAGSSKRTWNRLTFMLGPRQEDVGGDQIERGRHKTQAKVTIQVREGNREEGRPAEATKGHKQSPFSSSAFDRLPQPVAVVDVFFGSWWLVSALRTATRLVVIWLSGFLLWTQSFDVSVAMITVVVIYLVRWRLLKAGRNFIPFTAIPIPGKRELFKVIFRSTQKIWERVAAKALLRRYTVLCKIWWFVYLLITPMTEFRQNYMAAWRQREGLSIHIFVDDENMSIPIPADGTDEAMLARIRLFYQMMLVGQGFPALVFPKQLQRVDIVEMSKDSLVLGSRLGTLQLGRYKGRLVNVFENPKLGAQTVALADKIRTGPENSALEFQRTYDVGTISVVVAVPPLASLIFAIVWVSIHAHKRSDADFQVIVATAFTVASYIITAL